MLFVKTFLHLFFTISDFPIEVKGSSINDVNVYKGRESWCQFHQHFYVQFFCTNIVLAAFSSYILTLAKNSYEKCAQKMLLILINGVNFIIILREAFLYKMFLRSFFRITVFAYIFW